MMQTCKIPYLFLFALVAMIISIDRGHNLANSVDGSMANWDEIILVKFNSLLIYKMVSLHLTHSACMLVWV